jgi:DNA-binding GntR family transcriptional regulator
LALEKIRKGITTGLYPLGSPLYEKMLADDFGISKTPVREALMQLLREGLVNVVPHSGTFVFELSDGEVAGLCEIRLILETNALRLAMRRQPANLMAAMECVVEGMGSALARNSLTEYRDLDAQFHQAFFVYCGNEYLAKSYAMIEAKLTTLRIALLNPLPGEVPTSMEEHSRIAGALRQKKMAVAIEVLTGHIKRSEDLMQKLNLKRP